MGSVEGRSDRGLSGVQKVGIRGISNKVPGLRAGGSPEGPIWAEVPKKDETPAPVWDREFLGGSKIEPGAAELVPGSFLEDLIIRPVCMVRCTLLWRFISKTDIWYLQRERWVANGLRKGED